MNALELVNMAMQSGASWAGIERIALTKDQLGVAAFFPSEIDAEIFQVYAREFVDYKITREQEFVLIWL